MATKSSSIKRVQQFASIRLYCTLILLVVVIALILSSSSSSTSSNVLYHTLQMPWGTNKSLKRFAPNTSNHNIICFQTTQGKYRSKSTCCLQTTLVEENTEQYKQIIDRLLYQHVLLSQAYQSWGPGGAGGLPWVLTSIIPLWGGQIF